VDKGCVPSVGRIASSLDERGLLPAGSVDMVFRRPALQSPARRRALLRPTTARVDAVDDDWDKFADFARYDSFTARVAEGLRATC
jgi:modification methylase